MMYVVHPVKESSTHEHFTDSREIA